MTWLAIGLALLNACCFTAGTWLQHSVSGDGPSLLTAVRRPRWLAGLALLVSGAALHVVALQFAPVTVVEPVGVLGIVVSVLLGLRARGDRLRWNTGCALAAILVGTMSFAVLAALNTEPAPITAGALISIGVAIFVMVAVCLLIGRVVGGRARFLALGVGGGVAYGCTSTFVRAATERYVAHGVGVELLSVLVGLAAVVLAGFWLVQRAHAEGPPENTVVNLTVVDPLVAVSIGVGLLGEAPGLSLPVAGLGLACAALAIGGVVRLSRDVPTTPLSSLPPQSSFSSLPPYPYDRNSTCQATSLSASSSAPTPTLPTSTARRTSPTAWPPGSLAVVTTSMSSAPLPGTPVRSGSRPGVRPCIGSSHTAPRSIPPFASARLGGFAARSPGW